IAQFDAIQVAGHLHSCCGSGNFREALQNPKQGAGVQSGLMLAVTNDPQVVQVKRSGFSTLERTGNVTGDTMKGIKIRNGLGLEFNVSPTFKSFLRELSIESFVKFAFCLELRTLCFSFRTRCRLHRGLVEIRSDSAYFTGGFDRLLYVQEPNSDALWNIFRYGDFTGALQQKIMCLFDSKPARSGLEHQRNRSGHVRSGHTG